MGSVFHKLKQLLGMQPDLDDEGDGFDGSANHLETEEPRTGRSARRAKNEQAKDNLISLDGGASNTRVVILEPGEFSESVSIVKYIKKRNPVVVRLTKLGQDEGQRVIDFVSGATYALAGDMRELGENIFFFAPATVVIDGEAGLRKALDLGDGQ